MMNQARKKLQGLLAQLTSVNSGEDFLDSEYDYFFLEEEVSCKLPENLLQQILDVIRDGTNTKGLISQASLIGKAKELIEIYKRNGCQIEESSIIEVFNSIQRSFPKEEWAVFRSLHGSILVSNNLFDLGQFSIYRREEFEKHISLLPVPNQILETDLSRITSHLVISVKVQACDAEKALEFADFKFRQFDNIIRYMLSSISGNLDTGIFNYVGTDIAKSISISPTRYRSNSSIKGVIQQVKLDTEFPVSVQMKRLEVEQTFAGHCFFRNPNLGYSWIWSAFGNTNSTEMQKRILSAIEWVGKSLRDNDISRAFVQLVFALEVLFTFQQKNVLVNPSIASQIAEFAAFVLENDFDGRDRIEREVKGIYSKRSGIVHGGNSAVSETEYRTTLSLVRQLILKLTTQQDLLVLKTIDELNSWVKRKKFS